LPITPRSTAFCAPGTTIKNGAIIDLRRFVLNSPQAHQLFAVFSRKQIIDPVSSPASVALFLLRPQVLFETNNGLIASEQMAHSIRMTPHQQKRRPDSMSEIAQQG